MNKRIIVYILGWVLIVEGVAMQVCTLTSFIYREHEGLYFLITGAVSAAVGVFCVKFKKQKNMVLYQKAGFSATALSWILLSLVGCLPFWLSGEIPVFTDALFETVSGFTTTGATILTEVEKLSHGMLMWRSLMNWLGGMGVIVFLLALIPKLGGQQNIFLMKAGGGMEFFDAINTSFATAGTGGFGVRNTNMAAYHSYYLQTVIAVFMMLFGVNFSFYILLIARKFKQAFKITELWFYLGIIVLSTVIIGINIIPRYHDVHEAFHQSFFYVSSIITTTGFGIGDVNDWPMLSKAIILIITFIGAMAGSTGGGFKVSRIVLLAKEAKKEVKLLIHPRNVRAVKMDGKAVDHNIMRTTSVFLVLYLMIFIGSFLLVSIEGKDFVTSFTSIAATLNNTGPGMSLVGPVGNYATFTHFSKFVMMFDMLAGRLEIFPIIILFAPSIWKKV